MDSSIVSKMIEVDLSIIPLFLIDSKLYLTLIENEGIQNICLFFITLYLSIFSKISNALTKRKPIQECQFFSR